MAKDDEKKIERRYLPCAESREVDVDTGDEESRDVERYAMLYNSESVDIGFIESIASGAMDGVIERSDVFALLNHSMQKGVLARSNKGVGSLTLTLDKKGLKYRFTAPKSPVGEELLENLRRGEITGSSFSFSVLEDKWEKLGEDRYKRTILKIGRLYDVSPVYCPAYEATNVDVRGLDALKEADAADAQRAYDLGVLDAQLRLV